MTSFQQIGTNRVRAQERGPKRSWQKTIADHMQFRHGGPPKPSLSLWKRHRRPPKHSKRLSSDDARTPVERDLVHRRHRHCGACVVPSLLSEFSRVSTDRVSAASGIASSWPHSLASYAVENHRPPSPLANRGRSKERCANEFTVRLCYVGHLSWCLHDPKRSSKK
jgi:hypothetical protein